MHETTVDWETVRADAVALMSRYVQFDTTNPPGQEMAAAQWLCEQLLSRWVTPDVTVHEPLPGRGLLVARIAGEQALKPLAVNHHLDVVAADPAQWTYPPFSGAVADGFVWGRGTLDTKSLGIMFLLALERLVREGAHFRRPVVILAVPDEEAGSQGMRWFVERYADEIDPEWVWDEGVGGNRGTFGPRVLYGIAVAEKQVYQSRAGLPPAARHEGRRVPQLAGRAHRRPAGQGRKPAQVCAVRGRAAERALLQCGGRRDRASRPGRRRLPLADERRH